MEIIKWKTFVTIGKVKEVKKKKGLSNIFSKKDKGGDVIKRGF